MLGTDSEAHKKWERKKLTVVESDPKNLGAGVRKTKSKKTKFQPMGKNKGTPTGEHQKKRALIVKKPGEATKQVTTNNLGKGNFQNESWTVGGEEV